MMRHVQEFFSAPALLCLFIVLSVGVEDFKCSFDQQRLPHDVKDQASVFIESNYGHWSTAEIQRSQAGELRAQIRVKSAAKPYLNVIEDQDVWFWVHHRRYNLDLIELHEPAGVEREGVHADAELRLIHSRSKFWSHIFGDDRLIVSFFVKKAREPSKESKFFDWLDGDTSACIDGKSQDGTPWRDSLGTDCDAYSRYSLCTPDGHVGGNWSGGRPKLGGQIFPLSLFLKVSEGKVYGFEHYARDRMDARDACCACGGGGFHGIWPDVAKQSFLKFQTTCGGKATTWALVDKPLYASSEQLLNLINATTENPPNGNTTAEERRASSQTNVVAEGLEVGEIFVDDERFVIKAEYMSTEEETWRYNILLAVTLICSLAVVVTIIIVFACSPRRGYQPMGQKSLDCTSMGLLVIAVCVRWVAAIGLPIYAYKCGLVSAGAGFPWEVHVMFFVLVCLLCIYQLLNIRPVNESESALSYLACLVHGCLAILASYLEASFVVMAAAVLCPVYYSNAEWPSGQTAFLVQTGLWCFIYARLVFGLGVGLIGCVTYCCTDKMFAAAILAFRNNLELLGYWAVVRPEASEQRGTSRDISSNSDRKDPPGECICSGLYALACSPVAWILCLLAVVGQSLVVFVFGRTSGHRLPIVWASLFCTLAQHAMKASGFLPKAEKK